MTAHAEHQMDLCSLWVRFGDSEEPQFNSEFRGKVHLEIIELLKKHSEGLTDWQMTELLGYDQRNIVSPRRNELCDQTNKDTGKVKEGILEKGEIIVCPVSTKRYLLTHPDSPRDIRANTWRLKKNNLHPFLK